MNVGDLAEIVTHPQSFCAFLEYTHNVGDRMKQVFRFECPSCLLRLHHEALGEVPGQANRLLAFLVVTEAAFHAPHRPGAGRELNDASRLIDGPL